MSDKTKTPEPVVGSGGQSPSADTASRASAEGERPPEHQPAVPSESELDSAAPAIAPAEGEQPEPEPDAAAPEPAEAFALAGDELDALTAKAQKADEYLALAQRTQADFENYRKRAVREAAAAQERGAVKLALALLPAIDNLERALSHADTTATDTAANATGNGNDSLVDGIKHVHSDVLAALRRAGIEPYSPEGEPFDPQYHEAVAQQPVDGAQPGVIVEVFQRGYRIGQTVVRPARVVVAG